MPPRPDLSSYLLSKEESDDIFATQILPADFANLAPSPLISATSHASPPAKPPLAVLVVGQTGAGKTRLAPVVLEALSAHRSQVPAHFIADTYKTYHPSYARLSSDPQTARLASPATGPDARRWLLASARHAALLRLDVLLESACRHPDDFSGLARTFLDAGYRVEVLVMAIPGALSRLGILTRFHEKLPEAGSRGLPVRLTPINVHDDSYTGLLAAAEWLDAEGREVDQVLVVRRGNLVAFSDAKEENGSDGGKLRGLVAEAVRRERSRPLTETERQIAEADMQRLETRDPSLARDIGTMLEPLLSGEMEGTSFPELKPLELPPEAKTRDATLMLGGP